LRQSNKKLAASTGDRLYRLVNIYSLARKVFEAGQAARKWLHQPQVGLGGRPWTSCERKPAQEKWKTFLDASNMALSHEGHWNPLGSIWEFCSA